MDNLSFTLTQWEAEQLEIALRAYRSKLLNRLGINHDPKDFAMLTELQARIRIHVEMMEDKDGLV